MIFRTENNVLKIKSALNLNEENLYIVEQDNFKLTPNGLIVELEVIEMLGEKVISLELIALGYENLNAYKKYLITESELAIKDFKISKNDIDDLYINKINNKALISSIIVDVLLTYNKKFFCK